MALVTRSGDESIDAASGGFAPQVSDGLKAGEALDAVAPCYIKQSDGLVYMSNGTAANEAAGFDGVTPKAYSVGQPVTLFGVGAKFKYGSGLTPGAKLYIGATAGRLDTAATTGDAVGVAKVVKSNLIRVIRNA